MPADCAHEQAAGPGGRQVAKQHDEGRWNPVGEDVKAGSIAGDLQNVCGLSREQATTDLVVQPSHDAFIETLLGGMTERVAETCLLEDLAGPERPDSFAQRAFEL
jgi:hypothetical protein